MVSRFYLIFIFLLLLFTISFSIDHCSSILMFNIVGPTCILCVVFEVNQTTNRTKSYYRWCYNGVFEIVYIANQHRSVPSMLKQNLYHKENILSLIYLVCIKKILCYNHKAILYIIMIYRYTMYTYLISRHL